MSLAVDTTKRSRKYVITYAIVGLACFVMFIVSIMRYVYLNILEPVPIFFYAMLVWIILLRCKPTYDISVERKYLKIVKHDIWGKTKVFEIAWRRSFENGSEANVRIYFKASKQVIAALAEKMPNRVDVPEEMADFNMLVKEGVIVAGEKTQKKAEAIILNRPEEMPTKEELAEEAKQLEAAQAAKYEESEKDEKSAKK